MCKKIILFDEIAKLSIARDVTVTDINKEQYPACVQQMNFKMYFILSALLVSCQAAERLKKFEDLKCLQELSKRMALLRDSPDYRQARFLSSQDGMGQWLNHLNDAEKLLKAVLEEKISW